MIRPLASLDLFVNGNMNVITRPKNSRALGLWTILGGYFRNAIKCKNYLGPFDANMDLFAEAFKNHVPVTANVQFSGALLLSFWTSSTVEVL